MKTNTKTERPVPLTHEGTRAARLTDAQALRRAVASCFLWEDQFYESGELIADRIKRLTLAIDPEEAGVIAIDARNIYKLRHAPLWIARWLAAGNKAQRAVVPMVLEEIIQRPDQITEFMALYWKGGRTPLAYCVKKGLRLAFAKFDEYSLAKYNQDNDIKLRDVFMLVHGVTKDTYGKDKIGIDVDLAQPIQKAKYRRGYAWRHRDSLAQKLIEKRLATPDTWEVQLSAGKDKKVTWERLIEERKLGGLALLKNLRNMLNVGVEEHIIRLALEEMSIDKILPFRFITAAKYAPRLEDALEATMLRCLKDQSKLEGRTAMIVDTSPSMWQNKVSAKSEMSRFDAAAALAILCREVCEDVRVYWFNDKAGEIPARRGFALRDALAATQEGASRGGLALDLAAKDGYDRIVVFTDGEWHPRSGSTYSMRPAIEAAGAPLTDKAYMINVASNRNAVGRQGWEHIEGWSEGVIEFLRAAEALELE